METVDTLLLHEYDSQLARFRQLTEQASAMQHYAIVLSAAAWAWILVNGNAVTAPVLVILPAALTALYILKAAFIHKMAEKILRRLGIIEIQLGAEGKNALYRHRNLDHEDKRDKEDQDPDAAATRQKGIIVKLVHDSFEHWLFWFWTIMLAANIGMCVYASYYIDWPG